MLFTTAAASPDPSAFVLSVIALVLAGLSAAAAVAALWLTIYLHPKPYLIPRVRRDDPPDYDRPTFLFSLVDSGGAPAKDVSLILRSGLKPTFEQIWSIIELPLGYPQETRVSMVTGTTKRGWDRNQYGDTMAPVGEAKEMLLEFEVSWRQSPDMKKQRRSAYWVEVDEDRNVYLGKPKRSGWKAMGPRLGPSTGRSSAA